MAANLLCLTAGGGIPLFSRIRGDVKQLPFPVLGSLNGVHMFCDTHGVDLQSCVTEDSKVVWKNYSNSITLILVTQDDNATDLYLTQILDLVFHSMVLLYGLDDLSNIKNVERFKRDIKVCFQQLDSLLDQRESMSAFSDITGAVDVTMAAENAVLQTYLDAFADAINSPFGFLMVAGRVAVATAKWWEMEAIERVVLTLLLNSLSTCSSRDVPVFLPISSPKVPHRLLTFQLLAQVQVCVVCGPTPTLPQLQKEVVRFWNSAVDPLRAVCRLHPRCHPANITLDKNILGFLLENTETGKCLSSTQLSESAELERLIPLKKRGTILRSFYKSVIGKTWHKRVLDKGQDQEAPPSHRCESERLLHVPTDTYICMDTHKCYALWTGNHRLMALYTATMPTYAMRSVSHKTLESLLRDKNVTL